MAPTSRLLFTDPDQPTVATHLPLASLTPNQQLLPHPPTPAPFISIFQPEAPESALISMISNRPVSIVAGQSAASNRLPFAPPLPPRTTLAHTAQLPVLPPLPVEHTSAANATASFARPVCPSFPPSIPDARSRHPISARYDSSQRARTEVSAGTQRYPDDSHLCSSTFADIAFSHEFVSPRRMQQSQHTLLSFAPPRPPSGGNLNAVLASGASSSFDTAYAYD